MSTPVTYVGNSYSIPAYNDTGYAQGSGNVSSYLIALATGSLTLAGGTFPLTAPIVFTGFSVTFPSDITVLTAGNGIIVTDSANGKTYRICVQNGILGLTEVT